MFFHHKEQPRTQFYRTVATSFVVLSLIVVGVVFYISFSWATIILTPQDQYSDRTITIRIAESTNDEQGVVSGRIVTEELEAQGTFTPEFSSSVAQHVNGVITIVNTTTKSQTLRETTRLVTPDGVLFRTTEYIVVGAKESKEVQVVADSDGDIETVTNVRFVLPGLWPGLQDKIYGQGFELKEGGTKKIYTLSQKDIDRARENLTTKLKEKFLTIAQNTSSGSFHPKELRSVLLVKDVALLADKPIGTQTDSFNVRVKQNITGVLFDQNDIQKYTETVLRKELQSGYELVELDNKKFQYTLEDVDRVGNKALLTLQTKVGRIKSADYLALEKRSLVGKSVGQVLSYFESTPDITNIKVQFYPFWVTRTPLLHDHINIIVQKK